MERQNSTYDYTKRDPAVSIYNWTRPFQSMQEQLVNQQLVENATLEAENRKPPIPNIGLVPNRFGYRQYPPTISDILVIDDSFSASFGDFGNTESGYQGTSYPSVPQV